MVAWRSGLIHGRGGTHVYRRATYVPTEYYMCLAGSPLCLGAWAEDAAGAEVWDIVGCRTRIPSPWMASTGMFMGGRAVGDALAALVPLRCVRDGLHVCS